MDKFLASLYSLDKEDFNPDSDFVIFDKQIQQGVWDTRRTYFNKMLEDNSGIFNAQGREFQWNLVNIKPENVTIRYTLTGEQENISSLYSQEEQDKYVFFDMKISNISSPDLIPFNANYVWIELVDNTKSLEIIDEHGWTSLYDIMAEYSAETDGTKFTTNRIYNFVVQNIQFPRIRQINKSEDPDWVQKIPDSIEHELMTPEHFASFRCAKGDISAKDNIVENIRLSIRAWA
jgi:hypothetical protein